MLALGTRKLHLSPVSEQKPAGANLIATAAAVPPLLPARHLYCLSSIIVKALLDTQGTADMHG